MFLRPANYFHTRDIIRAHTYLLWIYCSHYYRSSFMWNSCFYPINAVPLIQAWEAALVQLFRLLFWVFEVILREICRCLTVTHVSFDEWVHFEVFVPHTICFKRIYRIFCMNWHIMPPRKSDEHHYEGKGVNKKYRTTYKLKLCIESLFEWNFRWMKC